MRLRRVSFDIPQRLLAMHRVSTKGFCFDNSYRVPLTRSSDTVSSIHPHLEQPVSLQLTNGTSELGFIDQHAQCHRITEPSMRGFNPTNCKLVAEDLCARLDIRIVTHNKWIWAVLPGCALAYYLPRELSPEFWEYRRATADIREKMRRIRGTMLDRSM